MLLNLLGQADEKNALGPLCAQSWSWRFARSLPPSPGTSSPVEQPELAQHVLELPLVYFFALRRDAHGDETLRHARRIRRGLLPGQGWANLNDMRAPHEWTANEAARFVQAFRQRKAAGPGQVRYLTLPWQAYDPLEWNTNPPGVIPERPATAAQRW